MPRVEPVRIPQRIVVEPLRETHVAYIAHERKHTHTHSLHLASRQHGPLLLPIHVAEAVVLVSEVHDAVSGRIIGPDLEFRTDAAAEDVVYAVSVGTDPACLLYGNVGSVSIGHIASEVHGPVGACIQYAEHRVVEHAPVERLSRHRVIHAYRELHRGSAYIKFRKV